MRFGIALQTRRGKLRIDEMEFQRQKIQNDGRFFNGESLENLRGDGKRYNCCKMEDLLLIFFDAGCKAFGRRMAHSNAGMIRMHRSDPRRNCEGLLEKEKNKQDKYRYTCLHSPVGRHM